MLGADRYAGALLLRARLITTAGWPYKTAMAEQQIDLDDVVRVDNDPTERTVKQYNQGVNKEAWGKSVVFVAQTDTWAWGKS